MESLAYLPEPLAPVEIRLTGMDGEPSDADLVATLRSWCRKLSLYQAAARLRGVHPAAFAVDLGAESPFELSTDRASAAPAACCPACGAPRMASIGQARVFCCGSRQAVDQSGTWWMAAPCASPSVLAVIDAIAERPSLADLMADVRELVEVVTWP